jgi:hypothetical protein
MGGHNGFSSSADDIVTYEHIISQEFLTKNSNLMEICADRASRGTVRSDRAAWRSEAS